MTKINYTKIVYSVNSCGFYCVVIVKNNFCKAKIIIVNNNKTITKN